MHSVYAENTDPAAQLHIQGPGGPAPQFPQAQQWLVTKEVTA